MQHTHLKMSELVSGTLFFHCDCQADWRWCWWVEPAGAVAGAAVGIGLG